MIADLELIEHTAPDGTISWLGFLDQLGAGSGIGSLLRYDSSAQHWEFISQWNEMDEAYKKTDYWPIGDYVVPDEVTPEQAATLELLWNELLPHVGKMRLWQEARKFSVKVEDVANA